MKQWTRVARFAISLLLALVMSGTYLAVLPLGDPDQSVAACGVERWSVKTGTDADAGLIDLSTRVPTTISAMRSLSKPATLPSNNRISPTETTVFSKPRRFRCTTSWFWLFGLLALLVLALLAWIPRLGQSTLAVVGWRDLPVVRSLAGFKAPAALLGLAVAILLFGTYVASRRAVTVGPRQ